MQRKWKSFKRVQNFGQHTLREDMITLEWTLKKQAVMWNEFYWFGTVNMTDCRELVETFGFHEMLILSWSPEGIQLRKRDPGTWG